MSVAAAGLAAVLAVGCSAGSRDDKADPAPSLHATVEPLFEETEEPAGEASSAAPSPGPTLAVGETGEFTVVDSSDPSVTTTMEVTVPSVKYVTSSEIDTTEPEKGQYALMTLTFRNTGTKPGRIMTYGAVKWQDAQTAAQDATTLESVDGLDVDTEYAPGQSVTGSIVLDIVRKGGTASYYDNADAPAFTLKLPE
ncbi:DUF4352 domain-containing protein [Streptomyces uncialis]|uniref:DUF4352 domain-containing protein n=1 Tax=Streptomyces uncialis TaxID=1048205 RepID=UPI00382AE510